MSPANGSHMAIAAAFEDFCEDLIRALYFRVNEEYPIIECREQGYDSDGVPLYQGGRDFDLIVDARIEVPRPNQTLFGLLHRKGRYLFEIKHVGSGDLSAERLAPNLQSIESAGVDHQGIVILTNAQVNPAIYQSVLGRSGRTAPIVILDGATLRAMAEHVGGDVADAATGFDFRPDGPDANPYSATTAPAESLRGRSVVLNYVFFNRTPASVKVSVLTGPDPDWQITTNMETAGRSAPLAGASGAGSGGEAATPPITLPPWTSAPLRLRAVSTAECVGSADTAPLLAAPSLRYSIGNGNATSYRTLAKPGTVSFLAFRAPYTGADHHALACQVRDWLTAIDHAAQPVRPRVLIVQGAAGVGKSRLLDEALENQTGQPKDRTPASATLQKLTFICDDKDETGRGGRVVNDQERSRFLRHVLGSGSPVEAAPPASLVDMLAVLEAATPDRPLVRCGLQPLLILDDAHAAGEALLSRLRTLAARTLPFPLHVVVIGRTDDSVRESAFLGFRDALTSAHRLTVPDLDADSTHALIRAIVDRIPQTAADRIARLSLNRPQYIVQAVLFLLDVRFVELVTRSTVSIINNAHFAARIETLPPTIEALMQARFDTLATIPTVGPVAQQALVIAALHGAHPPANLAALCDAKHGEAALSLLLARDYLRKDTDGPLRWSHESVWVFLRNQIREHIQALAIQPGRASRNPKGGGAPPLQVTKKAPRPNTVGACLTTLAPTLLETETVLRDLGQYWRPALLSLSGRHTEAVAELGPVIEPLLPIRSYMTCAESTTGYPFIEYAVHSLRADPQSTAKTVDESVMRLILGKAAMGTFLLSLAEGTQACRFGWYVAQTLKRAPREQAEFWLTQIIAHLELDSGQLGRALPKFLALRNRAEDPTFRIPGRDDREHLTLRYDIHNCLRMAFFYTNHPTLAASHGVFADRIAEEADARLRTSHGCTRDEDLPVEARAELLVPISHGDEAVRHFYLNPKQCRKHNRLGLKACHRHGNTHHFVHYVASLLACTMAACQTNPTALRRRYRYLEQAVEYCTRDLKPTLPRLHLLQGAIAYLLMKGADETGDTGTRERWRTVAHDTVRLGLEVTGELAVGYISWQLNNINAMLLHREGDHGARDKALCSAVAQIEAEGLLFMGQDVVASPVPMILANAVRHTPTDALVQTALQKLHSIDFYNRNITAPGNWGQLRAFVREHVHVLPGSAKRLKTTSKLANHNVIWDKRVDMTLTCWM